MPIFDSVLRPGGYVLYVHEFDKHPRKQVHQLVDGTQFVTQHGYEQRKKLIGRFLQSGEIEGVVLAGETGGYVRESQVSEEYEVGEPVGLYRIEVNYIRYTPSN